MAKRVKGASLSEEAVATIQRYADLKCGGNFSMAVEILSLAGDMKLARDEEDLARINRGGSQFDREAFNAAAKAIEETREPAEAERA